MSNVAEKLGDQTNRQVTDSDIESWALSAVGAIERFIAERNALRERVRSQDRELSLLREHVSLMRNSYRRLANEFVTELEIVDNLVPETTQLHERQKPTESSQFELSKTRIRLTLKRLLGHREEKIVMELGFAFLAIVLFIGLWLQT